MTDDPTYTTRALGPDTWDDFATLVEANNGVWGGCWCMGFHPEGLDRENASANRDAKRAHVEQGTVHQILVYADDHCVGWCQYGPPAELPNIKNPKAYAKDLAEPAGLADRLHLHRQVRTAARGRPGRGRRPLWTRSRRPAGASSRPTPNRSKAAPPQRGCLPPHRPRDPVRGVRLHPRPTGSPSGAG